MRKPELLAPAGNLEKLQMAVRYGADAVYLGGKSFGLRAFADNFEIAEMQEGIQFAHERGVRVYVTVNIFPHNADLNALPSYLETLRKIGADALLVSDPGVIKIAQETVPNLPLHLSTQANNVNWASAQFWAEHGVKRIVLARELSLPEIKEIRVHTTVELEVFVHGAMCISYSGRCLLSNYLAGRDANRGECAHPCRWRYALVEEKRPGQFYPVIEDERGTYIFNSRDLCLLPYLPELIKAGVDSFKIEGRMKSVHYVATVVRAYRQAIDACWPDPDQFQLNPAWMAELDKVSHRDYTTGFLFGKPTAQDQIYGNSSYRRTYDFIGLVREYNPVTRLAVVEQRGHFARGEEIEVVGPRTALFTQLLTELYDLDGQAIEAAPHPQQLVQIRVDQPVEAFDLLRRPRVMGEKGDGAGAD